MEASDQAREQLYCGVAPALALSDEAFAAYLEDLGRWEARLERVIESQLQRDVHYKERPGFNGGPSTRVVNLLGALKLKDVLGLEIEWSKKLSRGDGIKTPHLQWEVECRVRCGSKWQQPCVAIADTFESEFRFRRDFYQCPECGQKTVFRSMTGGGWYCSRRHGGCGKDYGEFDVAIVHQVRPTVERDDPRELSDLVLQTALARAIRRSVLRGIGRGRVLLVPAEDEDGTEAVAGTLMVGGDGVGSVSGTLPSVDPVDEGRTDATLLGGGPPATGSRDGGDEVTSPAAPSGGPVEAAPARENARRGGRSDQRDRLRTGLKGAAAAAQAQEMRDLQGPLQRASGVVMEREPDPPTKTASNGHQAEHLVADTLRLGEHQRAVMDILGERRFSAIELNEWAHLVQALPPGVEKLEYEAVLSMPDDVAEQLRALMQDQLKCSNEQVDALLKVCRSGRLSQDRLNELARDVGLEPQLDAAVVRGLDEGTAVRLLEKFDMEAARAA